MGGSWSWLWNFIRRNEENAPQGFIGDVNQPSDSSTMTAAGTSGPISMSPKSDLVKVNNAVWELYSPEGGNFDAEIIFFHGLHVGDDFEEAYWKAWLSTDETVIWPREWLTRKCESARMLSVSYNSSAMKKDRNSPLQMHNLGENLVNDIIYDARCGQAPWRPVILVGHCLGGIVIKQFIISAINMKNLKAKGSKDYIRIENFLNNFKGAFFYATPNGGSPAIEEWGKRLRNPSPLLELFQTLSIRTQRINEEFRQHRRNLDADTYAVAETHETNSLGFNSVVVPEASARHDIETFYTHPTANHFEVCRARDPKDSTVIGKLVHFSTDIMETAKEKEKEAAERETRFEQLRNFQNSHAGPAAYQTRA